MKKLLPIIVCCLCSFQMGFCQRGPLKGSGNIVNKTFAFKQFTAIELLDLDGNVTIEVGKPYAITVAIDDNLSDLLTINETNQQLTMALKGNTNNKLYVEATNIKINITLPTISAVLSRGNGNVTINNIKGNAFKVQQTGNGNTYLNGSVSVLDIVCNGNGNVYANKVIANSVVVKRSGNGNVYTPSKNITITENNGNGNIITNQNTVTMPSNKMSSTTTNRVTIYLKNNSILPKKPTVITYESSNSNNGTNSFFLMPGQRKQLQLLEGAKVYIATNNQVETVMSGKRIDNDQPFLIVKKDDNNRVFGL